MPKTNVKTCIIFSLLIFSGIVSWNTYLKNYHQKDTVDIHHFPKTLNGWSSEEIPISDEDYAILETRNAFVRLYRNEGGQEVMLFIVYSQHNRKVSHPPEICYSGGGNVVIDKRLTTLNFSTKVTMPAVRLHMALKDQKHFAYYWFKVGTSFTASYWQQQVLIAIKSLLGQPASSAMIRVSAPLTTNNATKATKDITDFTEMIYPILLDYLP